jgi:hypothetical protein
MKGKGAVGEGTWMRSPENPSCSPEALGNHHWHSLIIVGVRAYIGFREQKQYDASIRDFAKLR